MSFRFGHRAIGVCLFIFLLMALGACNAGTRYKMLSFFFDGVPPPRGYPARPGSQLEEKTTSTLRAAMAAGARRRAPAAVPTALPIVSTHPPVANKQCDQCHDTRRGLALFANEIQLCDRCHGKMRKEKKWNHGPINLGSCLPCHRAHDSPYPHLLDKPIPALCLGCHEEPSLGKCPRGNPDKIPPKAAKCIDCHDPHRIQS